MAFAASCTMMCGVSVWNPSGIGFVIICLSFEYLDEEEDFFVRKKIQQILQRGRMCAPTKNWPAGARDSSRGTVALRIRAGKAAITVKALRYLCPHVEQAVCPGICHMVNRFASVKTSALSIHHGWIRMNTDAIATNVH